MSKDINILNLIPDKGVYWTGAPVPELGIEKNMLINEVLQKIIDGFLELKNAKFNVGKLGNDLATRDEAINSLLGKVNTLSTSDISHNGIPFNNNKLSVEASKFLGSKFNYAVASDSNGARLDLNIKEQLPTKNILSTRIIVSGKSTNGKNVFMDTSELITSVVLKNEMYPIDIDVNVRTQTTTGVVDLDKKIVLHNPAESGSFEAVYDVKDRSYNAPFSGTLIDWLGGMEATQDRLEQYHDVLKNTSEGDIINVVNGNSYKISSLEKEVDQAKKVSISLANSNGTVTTKTTSPQVAIDDLSKQVNNLLSDSNEIKTDLAIVQGKTSNIPNPAGGGVAGTSNSQTQPTSGVI
jgi:hypothetical protein